MYLMIVVLAADGGTTKYHGKGYHPLGEIHVDSHFGFKSTDAAAQFAMLMLGLD
jgi:hypothetical protein